jgi:hypothetical protein
MQNFNVKIKIQTIASLRPEILNKTDRCEMTEHDFKKQSQSPAFGRKSETSWMGAK